MSGYSVFYLRFNMSISHIQVRVILVPRGPEQYKFMYILSEGWSIAVSETQSLCKESINKIRRNGLEHCDRRTWSNTDGKVVSRGCLFPSYFFAAVGEGVEKCGIWTRILVSRKMQMNISWFLAVAVASMFCGRQISFCYCAVCPEHMQVRHR